MFRKHRIAKEVLAPPIGSRTEKALSGPPSREIALKVAKGCAILAGVSLLCLATAAAAEEATSAKTFPGIVTSVSSSAIISTEGMSPGGEMWANWLSLPPGKAVEEPASPPNLGKWAVLQMMLSGSSVESGDPAPAGMCHGMFTGRRDDPNAPANEEFVAHPGDMLACNYTLSPRVRHENRGSEPNAVAALAVGGPWVPGMVNPPALYLGAGGVGKPLMFPQVSEVDKEIFGAGAMTLSIRKVVMWPGSRVVATDRYPTLRMVENGQLTWGSVPAGSAAATQPKTTFTTGRFEVISWGVLPTDSHIVLSNSSTEPVEFVEWSVAPAPDVRP